MTSLPTPRPARFASGAVESLPLSDGDWVLVRRELSYAQQRRLAASGLSGVPQALVEGGQGQELTVDLAAFDIEKLVTWILDWSFTDGDGNHVTVTREAIEGLTMDTAEEIHRALSGYIADQDAKKVRGGGSSAPGATSSSAAPSAGPGQQLMATPAPIVEAAVAWLNDAAEEAQGAGPGHPDSIEWEG